MTVPQLVFLTRLADRVMSVLSSGEALAWFNTKNDLLDGARPCDAFPDSGWDPKDLDVRAVVDAAEALGKAPAETVDWAEQV